MNSFLAVDLSFGDVGKGSWVDYISREHSADTVVRFNGGAQAAHRVVLDDGRAHVFSQFGSGTFAGAKTFLSRFMLVEPLAMTSEADSLRRLGVSDPFGLMTIDGRARITTPFHRAVNRLRELARGDHVHGSCGVGIGETMVDWLATPEHSLYAQDLSHTDVLAQKLTYLQQINRQKAEALPVRPNSDEWNILLDPHAVAWLIEAYRQFTRRVHIVTPRYWETLCQTAPTLVFEPAQGVLLDEWYGFHPYTTWSTTTLVNADQLLREGRRQGECTRVGLMRGYMTRHGAGPLVTESAEIAARLPDVANVLGPWQGGWRVGWLDLVALRYAQSLVGPLDGLVVSCLDRLATLPEVAVCHRYLHASGEIIDTLHRSAEPDLAYQETLTTMLGECRPILTKVADEEELLEQITQSLQLPILLTSHGETARDKRPHRTT